MTQTTSTRMTRTITTRASCTSEHGTWSALFRGHTLTAHAPHFGSRCSWVALHSNVKNVWFSLTSPSSLSTSTCPPVFFLSSVLMHPEHYTDLDNLDTVENDLRHSAKGSNDAYDVTHSLTGYEPNDTVVNELVNSQGSFSYITPSSDLDMDDTTLGKLLTEAHREYADYRSPEGVSVSQSSLSVVFDRTGKLVGERNVDQSIGFGVTRNTYSAHSKFSENTQAEKVVDRSGKPVGENSSNAQIKTLLDEQRQMIIAECYSMQLEPKKNVEFYKKNYGVSKWIFVKFINKVLLRWRNYENSRVLPSIRSQDGSSSRTRTLLWNYQEDDKSYKMK